MAAEDADAARVKEDREQKVSRRVAGVDAVVKADLLVEKPAPAVVEAVVAAVAKAAGTLAAGVAAVVDAAARNCRRKALPRLSWKRRSCHLLRRLTIISRS